MSAADIARLGVSTSELLSGGRDNPTTPGVRFAIPVVQVKAATPDPTGDVSVLATDERHRVDFRAGHRMWSVGDQVVVSIDHVVDRGEVAS